MEHGSLSSNHPLLSFFYTKLTKNSDFLHNYLIKYTFSYSSLKFLQVPHMLKDGVPKHKRHSQSHSESTKFYKIPRFYYFSLFMTPHGNQRLTKNKQKGTTQTGNTWSQENIRHLENQRKKLHNGAKAVLSGNLYNCIHIRKEKLI